jgi:hypothetical protein
MVEEMHIIILNFYGYYDNISIITYSVISGENNTQIKDIYKLKET